MDQLITEVLKIDNIAQEKIKSAKNKNRDILKNINKKKQAIIAAMKNEANQKLSNFEKCELENFEQQISILENKYKSDKKTLEQIYKENCDKWVKDIVSDTLSK